MGIHYTQVIHTIPFTRGYVCEPSFKYTKNETFIIMPLFRYTMLRRIYSINIGAIFRVIIEKLSDEGINVKGNMQQW